MFALAPCRGQGFSWPWPMGEGACPAYAFTPPACCMRSHYSFLANENAPGLAAVVSCVDLARKPSLSILRPLASYSSRNVNGQSTSTPAHASSTGSMWAGFRHSSWLNSLLVFPLSLFFDFRFQSLHCFKGSSFASLLSAPSSAVSRALSP